MNHFTCLLLSCVLIFFQTSCQTNDESKGVEETAVDENDSDFDYTSFSFREKAKFKILHQPIFSNANNPLEGIWLEGVMMKYNYVRKDTSFSSSKATLNTYAFTSDSTFNRRGASYVKVMSYSGSYIRTDSTIVTKRIQLEDENSVNLSLGVSKEWGYDILNDSKLILHEERIQNTSFSFLFHKLKNRNLNHYTLQDIRSLLHGNIYCMMKINGDYTEEAYVPVLYFSSDSTYVTSSFQWKDWNSLGSVYNDLEEPNKSMRSVYLIDDFSIKDEIFIRMPHYPSIQIGSIRGDTIVGYTHGVTVDSVQLILRNRDQ